MLLPLHVNGLNLDSGTAVAVVSGTLDGSTETDIVNGGRTIIITLTNDTWVTAGATFNAQRQNIIDGLDSAQSEALGWNNEVRDKEVVGSVVRTSDTVVTITLSASSAYDITSDEVITVTIPGTALTGASQIVAAPTIGVSAYVGGKKGRIRAPKRYVVEVDKQIFFVNTISEAEALLARVRELADESAERDVTEPVTPKPPRIKVRTGTGKKTTSQALQREVKKTQNVVRQAYNRRAQSIAQDIEISRLLLEKFEKEARDDEQAIISLLLM